jgi:hypothetical protein
MIKIIKFNKINKEFKSLKKKKNKMKLSNNQYIIRYYNLEKIKVRIK